MCHVESLAGYMLPRPPFDSDIRCTSMLGVRIPEKSLNYSRNSISFFLSFFLSLTSFYLLIVGLEVCCST
jgi:hypothetical protein